MDTFPVRLCLSEQVHCESPHRMPGNTVACPNFPSAPLRWFGHNARRVHQRVQLNPTGQRRYSV